MKFNSELIRSATKRLILSALKDEEMYGYQIIKFISQQSSDLLKFGEGTVYPALHDLEKAKMIESRWVEQEKGPARKYYQLTSKGRRTLKEDVREWKSFVEAVNNVLNAFQNA